MATVATTGASQTRSSPVPAPHTGGRDAREHQLNIDAREERDRRSPNGRDAWERRQAESQVHHYYGGGREDWEAGPQELRWKSDIIAEKYPPVPPFEMKLGPSDEALFNESLQFILTEGLGQTGEPLKAFVRIEDLTDPEFIKYLNSQSVSITRPDPAVQDNGITTDNPPDSPRNLELLSAADVNRLGLFGNTLTWEVPVNDIDDIAATEIWVAESQNRSDAVFTGLVTYPGYIYTHASLDPAKAYYYWIRCVNWAGQYSVWEPSSDQGGYVVEETVTTLETVDKLMAALMGEDPAAYAGGTTYYVGDLCSHTVGDNTRRYKCILESTGNLPTNTTYWERVGILLEGDIDGTPTIGIDGNLVVDGSIIARTIAADTITANEINGGGLGTLTITSGKIAINTTDALEIQAAGNMKILAGGDLEFIETDTNPALIKWSSYHVLGAEETDHILGIGPTTAKSYVFWVGYNANAGSVYRYNRIKMETGTEIYLRSWYDSNYQAVILAHTSSTEGYIRFESRVGGTIKYIYFNQALYPGVNKSVNLGAASYAWDDCYADDFNNVADFYHLDDRDDMAAIKAIKGSGKYNPLNELELIDDDTIPTWMLSKHKHDKPEWIAEDGRIISAAKKGDIMYTADGDPYLSLKLLASLCMGALRQLDTRIENLEN